MIDLDHYFRDPYQDQSDNLIKMNDPFETNPSRRVRDLPYETTRPSSSFSYFMDGTRRTYKIGDMVIAGKKIYPVISAQICAGVSHRDEKKKIHPTEYFKKSNYLLISDSMNREDHAELSKRIERTALAKSLQLKVLSYSYDSNSNNNPTDAAVAKANSLMHDMEVDLLSQLVKSGRLSTREMLIVDGPLQFLKQDDGSPEYADMFYNVAGVSKSFNPMMPISGKARRGNQHIGAELLKLKRGQRTPVFLKRNSRGRQFGCWYLRIRDRGRVSNPLDGIVKIEKMALREDLDRAGLDTDTVDTISLSIMHEAIPTCFGRDKRWANHLYPVYLTETYIKSTLDGNEVFMHNFRKNIG